MGYPLCGFPLSTYHFKLKTVKSQYKYEKTHSLDLDCGYFLCPAIQVSNKSGQQIKIYYKFVGALKTIDFGEAKVKPIMKVRKLICPECNKEFETTSAVAKYCDDCKPIVKKRQGNESKRRCRALERAKKDKEVRWTKLKQMINL